MAYVPWKEGGVWGNILDTWGDYQLVEEVAAIIDVDGSSSWEKRKKRQGILDNYLDKEPEKKKRLIHLICRIEGVKVYDDKKEVNDEIEVSVEKVEMLIKEVIGKVKVKDVI